MIFTGVPYAGSKPLARNAYPWVTIFIFGPYHTAIPWRTDSRARNTMIIHGNIFYGIFFLVLRNADKIGVTVPPERKRLMIQYNAVYIQPHLQINLHFF